MSADPKQQNRKLDHMDKLSRNERLYGHLLSQGYYVNPVYGEGEYGGIEFLQVSTDKIKDQQFQG